MLVVRLMSRKERVLLLAEVVPQGRITSQEEGIVEYKGITFVLGTNDLKRKKDLIKTLKLLDIEGSYTVDMRFNRQIIVKSNDTWPEFDELTKGQGINH